MSEQPSTGVLPHELPASLRGAGLDNWIREPLDDAVDRHPRLIMPPAVAVLGTPARGHQGPLLAEARHPDTLFAPVAHDDLAEQLPVGAGHGSRDHLV